MDGVELLRLLGLDLFEFIVSVMSLVIVLVAVFSVRIFRLREKYDRYEKQIKIVLDYAPDLFLRLAFPEVDDEVLALELEKYEEIANQRVADGLSWVDPRMLYAIDRLELALPEGWQVDFNVVLDRAETLYQKMKEAGAFEGRTDDQLLP